METVDRLPQTAFDDLPIGAVLRKGKGKGKGKGKIVRYNRTEGELTNRDPQREMGAGFSWSWLCAR